MRHVTTKTLLTTSSAYAPVHARGKDLWTWYKSQNSWHRETHLPFALALVLRDAGITGCLVPPNWLHVDKIFTADITCPLQFVQSPEEITASRFRVYLHTPSSKHRLLPVVTVVHTPPLPLDHCFVILGDASALTPLPLHILSAVIHKAVPDTAFALDTLSSYAEQSVVVPFRHDFPAVVSHDHVLREAVIVRSFPNAAASFAGVELDYVLRCCTVHRRGVRGLLADRMPLAAGTPGRVETLREEIEQWMLFASSATPLRPEMAVAWVHAGFKIGEDIYRHYAVARIFGLALLSTCGLGGILSVTQIDVLNLDVPFYAGGPLAQLPLAAFRPQAGAVYLVLADSGQGAWQRLCRHWNDMYRACFVLVGKLLANRLIGYKWGQCAYEVVPAGIGHVQAALEIVLEGRNWLSCNRGTLAALYSLVPPLIPQPIQTSVEPEAAQLLHTGWFGTPLRIFDKN